MKFLMISFALAAVASAQLEKIYQGTNAPGYAQYARILEQTRQQHPDGSYSHSYKTENGINVSEEGHFVPTGPHQEPELHVSGKYEYIDTNNKLVTVEYTAGPQGFVPGKSYYSPGPEPTPYKPYTPYNPYQARPLGVSK